MQFSILFLDVIEKLKAGKTVSYANFTKFTAREKIELKMRLINQKEVNGKILYMQSQDD